jgi:hypothetical protein
MAFHLEIPKELAHLKLDTRGYPIPYFVSWINGQPEFRFLDPARLEMIIERKVCHICGKKLPTDFFYFITGPVGLQNRVITDAPMHRLCAEFSLKACPHIYYQKAERRDNDPLAKSLSDHTKYDPGKPSELYLIKSDKAKPFIAEGRRLLRFRPVTTERYYYEAGKLIKANQ